MRSSAQRISIYSASSLLCVGACNCTIDRHSVPTSSNHHFFRAASAILFLQSSMHRGHDFFALTAHDCIFIDALKNWNWVPVWAAVYTSAYLCALYDLRTDSPGSLLTWQCVLGQTESVCVRKQQAFPAWPTPVMCVIVCLSACVLFIILLCYTSLELPFSSQGLHNGPSIPVDQI